MRGEIEMSEYTRVDERESDEDRRRPMSPDVTALLRETRHAVSEGRTLPDSTELIRLMREERSEHLAKP